MKKLDYVKVVCKQVSYEKNGKKLSFPTYYAIVLDKTEEGYEEHKRNDGKTITINVNFTKDCKELADKVSKHSQIVGLDKGDYFITYDKDSEGIVKVDKFGIKRRLLVIKKATTTEDAPYKEFTFEDLRA